MYITPLIRSAEACRRSLEKGKTIKQPQADKLMAECSKSFNPDTIGAKISLLVLGRLYDQGRLSEPLRERVRDWRISVSSRSLPTELTLPDWPLEAIHFIAYLAEKITEDKKARFFADLRALIKQLGNEHYLMIARILQEEVLCRLVQVQFAGLVKEECVREAHDPSSALWIVLHYHSRFRHYGVEKAYQEVEQFGDKQGMRVLERILRQGERVSYGPSLFSWLKEQLKNGKAPLLIKGIPYLGVDDDAPRVLPYMDLPDPLWELAKQTTTPPEDPFVSSSLPFIVAYHLQTIPAEERAPIFTLIMKWVSKHYFEMKQIEPLIQVIASIKKDREAICLDEALEGLPFEQQLEFLQT